MPQPAFESHGQYRGDCMGTAVLSMENLFGTDFCSRVCTGTVLRLAQICASTFAGRYTAYPELASIQAARMISVHNPSQTSPPASGDLCRLEVGAASNAVSAAEAGVGIQHSPYYYPSAYHVLCSQSCFRLSVWCLTKCLQWHLFQASFCLRNGLKTFFETFQGC